LPKSACELKVAVNLFKDLWTEHWGCGFLISSRASYSSNIFLQVFKFKSFFELEFIPGVHSLQSLLNLLMVNLQSLESLERKDRRWFLDVV
jgi:hypothetical protein